MEASPTPPAAPAAKPRIGVGDTIGEAFDVYRQNFGALFGSALVVFAVVGLIGWLLELTDAWLLGLLAAAIRLAGHSLYTGFVVRLVQDVRDGRRDNSIEDLFSAVTPVLLALIVFGILAGIGITIGFIFVIVPGLVLLTFWAVGAPAIVVEDIGPIEAFGRSWKLVRGNAWSVFGVILVTFLIVIVISVVLTVVGAVLGDIGLLIASILSGGVTAPIYALVAAILYFELSGGGARAAQTAPAAPPPPPSA